MNGKGRALRLLSVCRVSSREQSEGYSLDAQNQTNHEWAQRKGHTIADSIQYVETASKQKERRRFREIINRICSDTQLDGVVFHKVDRASRNLTDLAVLEKVETEVNKKVFFSSQEFPQNAAGRLGIGVMGVVSRWYTDNLKEEINKGFRSKVEAGEYPHKPPYGYRIGQNSKGSKLPVPDPKQAKVVRTIFELMASGDHTLDTLREELFQRGLYFSSRTRRWTRSYLARLLRHQFYIGRILWREQIYEGKHTPIIDQKLWAQVQDVLERHSRPKKRTKRRFTYGHGLLRCAECGYSITAEIHKRQYIYYRCAQISYRQHATKPEWVPEPVVEDQIVALLAKLAFPRDVYDWAIAYLRHTLAKDVTDTETKLRKLAKKAADMQAGLDALLVKAAQTDEALADEFLRLARQKQQELAMVRHRIDEVKAGERAKGDDAARILELTQDLSSQYVRLPSNHKRQVVDSVFSNLRLNGVSLDGNYRLPFAILAENGNCPLESG